MAVKKAAAAAPVVDVAIR